ncbi:uncharacterized protein NEMAJ01_1670 [Nematocida major]|uniref:uncharacterized protein n=1 Tax=Nematocida major TaxID=1912982 RepID=UPI002008714A|nr:uncharacterized protein NEMAJ01_1670 [Nematocida major]KAH9386774.1 hypothetical protein NEMAJ01_1670 [Nematocida major]
MGYFCAVCNTLIKSKTPKGWIDHIRGVRHKQNIAEIIRPESAAALGSMVLEGVLKEEERKGILGIISATPSREDSRQKILAFLNGVLVRKSMEIFRAT